MSFELPKIAKKDGDVVFSNRLTLEIREVHATFIFRTVDDAVQFLEAKCKGKRAGDVGILYRDFESSSDKSLSVNVKEYKKIIEILNKHGRDLTPNLWTYANAWKYCPNCQNFATCHYGKCEVCNKDLDDPARLTYDRLA